MRELCSPVFDMLSPEACVGRLCSLCRSRNFDGARTALYLIPVGTGLVLVLLVAGFFLLADLLLLVRRTIDFAAQSNLAFLGMWIELTRPDLAELLPFDADAGSSSNMVSSQPGVPLGLQSWSARSKNTIRLGASYFSMEETSDLRI